MIDNSTIQFIKEHEKDDVRKLALQASRYPDRDMPFIIQQIAGRQISKDKLPTWYDNENIIYPVHLSLEQCSSEKTAIYKASLCQGKSFIDLTGGLGVDFSFMSQQFDEAIYVEQNIDLIELASHNMQALGLKNISIVNDNAESYLSNANSFDTIYLDPARRNTHGQKTVLIEDCTPNLREIGETLFEKGEQVIIKLSPMLDISLALKSLSEINQVHIVSVNNECKELLFVKDKAKADYINFKCINILNNQTQIYSFEKEGENETIIAYTNKIEKYLYEPNPSVLKAGAYKSIARDFSINKLHQSSHLYTSDELVENFSGRKFEIISSFEFNKKELKQNLSKIDKANITVRNFPLSVAEIRKKTNIKEGGEIYIFATTLSNEKRVFIVCKKI